MNYRRTAVRAARFTLLLLGVSAAAWPAGAPTAADLARCAAMTAPDARLACYDSLSTPTNGAPAATPAAAAPAPAPQAAPAAAAPPPAAPTAPLAAAPAPAPAPADDPANFGFTPAQVQAFSHAPAQGPQSIQALLTNILTDRQGNGYVLLDNGQMWTYQGDDGRMRPGESVTIKRASLGSFIMVTKSRRSYHVTRVR